MLDLPLSIAVAVVAIGAYVVSRHRGLIDAMAKQNEDPAVAGRRAALFGKYRVNRVGAVVSALAAILYVLTVLTVFEEVDQTLNALILSVFLFFPYAIAAAFVYGLYGLLVTLIGR